MAAQNQSQQENEDSILEQLDEVNEELNQKEEEKKARQEQKVLPKSDHKKKYITYAVLAALGITLGLGIHTVVADWLTPSYSYNGYSTQEIKKQPDYDESINEIMESKGAEDATDDADSADDGELDDRLQEAIEMVLTDGQASISMLQRRMKIGYARAGRLIDDMAARGIVSKSAGSKPREILITYEQYLQKKDTLLR